MGGWFPVVSSKEMADVGCSRDLDVQMGRDFTWELEATANFVVDTNGNLGIRGGQSKVINLSEE